MSVTVGITITTHNRRDELARTLRQLAALSPAPSEIIVCADGCADGTVEFVRAEHPGVRLIIHEVAQGSIPSRNELALACRCDVFVSLDDDSYPLQTDFLEQVALAFQSSARLAVLGFAQRSDEFPETLTSEDFGRAAYVASYVNSGAAIRRRVFEALGGYPAFFFHAYEEPDFALRCVCHGWQVRYEPRLLIRHHFTAMQRNEIRTHHRHARNELWSVLLRCPMPQLFAVGLFRVVRQLAYALKRGPDWVWQEPAWWRQFLVGAPAAWRNRQPLSWDRYSAWMRLMRKPIESDMEWSKLFGDAAS